MKVDFTTLLQLGVFDENESRETLFHLLDHTISSEARALLRTEFLNPLKSKQEIENRQGILKAIAPDYDGWNGEINNGVIFVLEQYCEDRKDFNSLGEWHQTLFLPKIYKADFENTKFAVEKLQIFLKGMWNIYQTWNTRNLAIEWQSIIENIGENFDKSSLFRELRDERGLSNKMVLKTDYYMKRGQKVYLQNLLRDFYLLDMYFSMSAIADHNGFSYPSLQDEKCLDIHDFFHPLLSDPTPYDLKYQRDNNFIFLTGANMSGKSTFIRALGILIYLAHLGIAVPASAMTFSYMDGLSCSITNLDNILEGESFFYSEVKRIQEIISRIEPEQHWMVLMDELFKGTNYKDALRCTEAIVRGMVKYKNSYFLLCTHLYELANILQGLPLDYKYFETVYDEEGMYHFTYNILDGVSQDTIGFQILKNSGVLDKLDSI